MKGEALPHLGDRARLVDDEAGDGGRLLDPASSNPSTRFRSRMVTAPSTLTEPSGCLRTPGMATSCSSVMSPTISSSMSSSVTRPSTTPYSSTTRANGVLRRRNALSWLGDGGACRARTKAARISPAMSTLVASPSSACSARNKSLTCRMPTMFSGLPRQSGMRVHRRGDHRVDQVFRLFVGVERDHAGAVDHHVGDHQLAQVEHAAEHVAVERLHVAFAMQQIDGAAQFLARRQHLLVFADRHADTV